MLNEELKGKKNPFKMANIIKTLEALENIDLEIRIKILEEERNESQRTSQKNN